MLEKLANHSAVAYVDYHGIKNEKGERLEFYDRPFLIDILADFSQYIALMKAAQFGGSVIFTTKSLFATHKLRWNVIHTFPTDTSSNEYVKTKTNKMLSVNDVWSNIDQDSIQIKEIDRRFLYYKGTKSPNAAVMTTADGLIHDEYDRGDISTANAMDSRLQGSKIKFTWWLSNPTYEGVGIHEKWLQSDQKEWFVTCVNGHSHYLTWPDSIDQELNIFICKECRVELTDDDRRHGVWIPTNPGVEISGYHVSALMYPWETAKSIIRKFDDGKNLENFYNFVLGLPYSPENSRITREMVMDNYTRNAKQSPHTILGIDVGAVKYYCFGTERQVREVGTFTDWNELDDIIDRLRPTVTVMDAEPENEVARYYSEKYDNFYISYFSQDHQDNSLVRWGTKDKVNIVYSDRNRVIDRIVHQMTMGEFEYCLRHDKKFEEFIKHCTVMRRVKVVNRLEVTRYVWTSKDTEHGAPDEQKRPDHFFFAKVYWWLGREALGNAIISVPEGKKKNIISVGKDSVVKSAIDKMD